MSEQKPEDKKIDQPTELTDTDVETAVGGRASVKNGNTIYDNKYNTTE